MVKIEQNIYDFIGNINPVLRAEMGDRKFYVVGGIVTSILLDNETVIDEENKTTVARSNINLSNYRSDGSKRDLDIVFLDKLVPKERKHLKKVIATAIDNRLVPSVFDLKDYKENRNHVKANLLDWLSKRTIDENGIIRYELFPLSQEVCQESFDQWFFKVANSDSKTPMLHPVGHVLAYKTRSIYGVKHKDQAKVSDMFDKIINLSPNFKYEAESGIFKDWRHFAELIETLNREHSSENSVKLVDFLAFRLKSRILSSLESNPKIVTLSYSNFINRILETIIHS